MNRIYVLMYRQRSAGPDGKEFFISVPYAAFGSEEEAKSMQRPGDEIFGIPYIADSTPAPKPGSNDRATTGIGTGTVYPPDKWWADGDTPHPCITGEFRLPGSITCDPEVRK